jgi:hypothetical protein
MRNMSFALTTAQILAGSKTVTRRLGWLHAKPGQLIRPVRKCMGLQPGERIKVLRPPLRIVDVRREPLRRMTDDFEYGLVEVALEGFANDPEVGNPDAWVEFFIRSHRGCAPETVITRIAFSYELE